MTPDRRYPLGIIFHISMIYEDQKMRKYQFAGDGIMNKVSWVTAKWRVRWICILSETESDIFPWNKFPPAPPCGHPWSLVHIIISRKSIVAHLLVHSNHWTITSGTQNVSRSFPKMKSFGKLLFKLLTKKFLCR